MVNKIGEVSNESQNSRSKTGSNNLHETLAKSPLLEAENFNIDLGLTNTEKWNLPLLDITGQEGKDISPEERQEMEKENMRGAFLKFRTKSNVGAVTLIRKELDTQETDPQKRAYIREHQDGQMEGEQLFNIYAEEYLVKNGEINQKRIIEAEDSRRSRRTSLLGVLILNHLQDLGSKNQYRRFLKNYFEKNGNKMFVGYFNAEKKQIDDVGCYTYYRLFNGKIMKIGEDGIRHSDGHNFYRAFGNPSSGYSLRLLSENADTDQLSDVIRDGSTFAIHNDDPGDYPI